MSLLYIVYFENSAIEIGVCIFLEIKDVLSVRSITKIINSAKNNYLWLLLAERDFGIRDIHPDYVHAYMEYFSIRILKNTFSASMNIKQFSVLRELSLRSYEIKNKDIMKISILTNLQSLTLENRVLNSVPLINDFAPISGLTSLVNLDITHGYITCLSHHIGLLTNLEHLFLSDNFFADIPDEIIFLTKLSELQLHRSNITYIPPNISCLTNLEKMFFHMNKISDVPIEIFSMPKLKFLALDNNKIESFPPKLNSMCQIESISLGLNSLTEITPEIKFFSKLGSLSIVQNKLQKFPPEFKLLTNLKTLSLYLNNFTYPLDNLPNEQILIYK